MTFLFRRVGDAVNDAAGIALDFGQRRRKVVGNAGQEFLAVLVIFGARLSGRTQLEAHLFKGLAGIADFIMREDRHGPVQIPLTDGIGHVAQAFHGFDDLPGHPERELEADDDGQDNGQDSEDIKGDLQYFFRRQVDVFAVRIDRHGTGDGQMDARTGRDIVKTQALAVPVEVGMILAALGRHFLAQIVFIDAVRMIKVLVITPDGDVEALVFQMVRGLQETEHIAVIAVGPHAEAAQFELDGHILPAFRPDEGDDVGPVDIAELQAQEDGDTDEGRKEDGNEDHDEVGKKEPFAQRPVPEFHRITFPFKYYIS